MSEESNVRAYDPRDTTQSLDDPATWRATTNPVLIAANVLAGLPVDWESVAKAADAVEVHS